MMNKVILIGRLTRDPELRYTPKGTPVGKFTLAVDRRTKKDQEKEADFIDVITWDKQAEACGNYLAKGKLVAVEGRLQVRSYDDSQGVRRKAAEVVASSVRFLEKKDGAAGGDIEGPQNDGEITFDEDDIPF
ncbi:MAG: single-stranded DNA-binding protein [Pelotomaculum sp.]|nr:single-stranded DNA-binding protein [Pelotomaculum sp.]